MADLIISRDEKWPIYELEIPEEGQSSNCKVPEEVYREYLSIMINYSKMQKILKELYEDFERLASTETGDTGGTTMQQYFEGIFGKGSFNMPTEPIYRKTAKTSSA